MLATDRGYYIPRVGLAKADPAIAYEDSPQLIGFGATISAPHMHSMVLEIAKDRLVSDSSSCSEVSLPETRVLDVGSGSGYLVAAFSRLGGPRCRVFGIEHIPELVEFSTSNLRADDEKLLQTVDIRLGDGRLGLPQGAPFDVIHVGAAAESVPEALIDQLKPGGKLIIPVGKARGEQTLDLYVKDEAEPNKVTKKVITTVQYVPLTSQDKQLSRTR